MNGGEIRPGIFLRSCSRSHMLDPVGPDRARALLDHASRDRKRTQVATARRERQDRLLSRRTRNAERVLPAPPHQLLGIAGWRQPIEHSLSATCCPG